MRGRGYNQSITQSATGEHGNRLRGSSATHTMTTATNGALRQLALARGDAAPNSNTTMLVERSYEQLTRRINVQVQEEMGKEASLSLVKKVMKSEPHIKLSGRVASVPECNECCNFKLNASPTEFDRQKHEIHLQIQQGERSVADLHCKKAINNPNDHLTIYMDGMDQAKTAVSHLSSQKPKWLDGITPWKVHVTGVMAFGPQKTFAYLNYDHIKSCASLSIHVLDDVLRRLWEYIGNDIAGRPQPEENDGGSQTDSLDGEEKEGGHDEDSHHHSSSNTSSSTSAGTGAAAAAAAAAAPSPRAHPRYTRYPENLHLVMDNSGRDNKNNAVFRYLVLLVKRGIFKSVQVNFLLVGHTHDRVDQFFSCISRQLGREDAWTPAELRQQIRAAYSRGRSGAGEERDPRFQGDLTIDPLCRERPLFVVLDQIMEWSLWLEQGGVSVRAQASGGASKAPVAVVGQRLDSSFLSQSLLEENMDTNEDTTTTTTTTSTTTTTDGHVAHSEDADHPPAPVVNTKSTDKAHGLPVFCGRIKNINKPQVFRFTMNLLEEVVVRIQPSSYILDVKCTGEGKLEFKLEHVELQAPVVLMAADAPVPCIDPIPSPPQPFPYDSLLATYTTMDREASSSFTSRRQGEWASELHRVSSMLAAQGHCERCQELQQRISSVKVATGRKMQRMTEELLRVNKQNARLRSGLQAELSRHLSSGHQPVKGIWTRPWQPWLTHLLDPVQLRIPGRVSHQLAQRDTALRQSLYHQQREGHVDKLQKFILDSTLSSTNRMRFEHALKDQSSTALISVESTKAARDAAASAAEASQGVDITEREGQDRRIPIQVGDIVAVHVDNYQWPEYPVCIALVVGVTPPARAKNKRKRGAGQPKAAAKGRKGKEDATSHNKRRCNGRGVSAAVAAATAPGSGDDGSSIPPPDLTHATTGAEPATDAVDNQDMEDDREATDKTQLQVVFYYLRYPSHTHACQLLDAKVEHYKRHGASGVMADCLDKALTLFHMKRKPKRRSVEVSRSSPDRDGNPPHDIVHGPHPPPLISHRSERTSRSSGMRLREGKDEKEEDEMVDVVIPSSGESSVGDNDAEYHPSSEEELMEDRLVRQRKKLGRRRARQRARLAAARHEGQPTLSTPSSNPQDPSLPPTTSTDTSPSLSSSSSASTGSSLADSPSSSHPPFSSHFVWTTGGLHLPATWWKVFTEVNDLFEAAKPDAKVLGRLAPWFSVADLEREQLGMVDHGRLAFACHLVEGVH